MSIQIIADNQVVPVEHIKFSDGGSNLRVLWPEGFIATHYIALSLSAQTPVDEAQWLLQLAVCALEGQVGDFSGQWVAYLPYLPHGRADRRFDKHCAFPLETFLAGISVHFSKVYLTDPHSSYAEDFLNGMGLYVEIKEQHDCFLEMGIDFDPRKDMLIAPDAGAEAKVRKLHEALSPCLFECATKTRDPNNGRVLTTTLPDLSIYEGRKCVIVDDICDGGGTFIPLAKALRDKGAESVELYVTHGIFAKGLDVFKGVIDKLHVYQIVGNYISREDLAAFNNTTWSNEQ